MSNWTTVLMVALVVAAGTLAASPTDSLSAQELYCGIDCMKCGPELKSRQGMGAHPEGAYFIYCASEETTFCDEEFCEETVVTMSASEIAPTDGNIVAAFREASLDELQAFVSQHQSRLLLHEGRRLLALLGTGCSRDVVTTVVFLNRAEVAALATMGLTELSGYLDG